MGKTTYCCKWEQSFPVKNEMSIAYCKICVKSFRIDNSVLSQVKSHAK